MPCGFFCYCNSEFDGERLQWAHQCAQIAWDHRVQVWIESKMTLEIHFATDYFFDCDLEPCCAVWARIYTLLKCTHFLDLNESTVEQSVFFSLHLERLPWWGWWYGDSQYAIRQFLSCKYQSQLPHTKNDRETTDRWSLLPTRPKVVTGRELSIHFLLVFRVYLVTV